MQFPLVSPVPLVAISHQQARLSGSFGFSGLFGSPGWFAGPANQTDEIDQTNQMNQMNRPCPPFQDQHLASTACQTVSKSVSFKDERLLRECRMGIADLLKFKRPEILRLAQAHGAHNVRIFGSVARGEAHADSDIDFLVEMDNGRSLLDLIELSQDLETLLQRKVDVFTDTGLSPYLEQGIHAEAVLL